MPARLRFALMGLGNVGGIYVTALKDIPEAELVGFIEASAAVKPGYPNRIEIHGEKGGIKLRSSGILPRPSAKTASLWRIRLVLVGRAN